MAYEVQYYPGESVIAENRKKHMNPDHELKKLRNIAEYTHLLMKWTLKKIL